MIAVSDVDRAERGRIYIWQGRRSPAHFHISKETHGKMALHTASIHGNQRLILEIARTLPHQSMQHYTTYTEYALGFLSRR